MRRPAPTLPISSKQLKHFAAATVAITTLLALFAGGDDIGVAAQIDATQAKNDLIAAEQKKLGTKQLATHMKVKTGGGGFGEDSGGGFGMGDGGGGASSARRSLPKSSPQGPAFLPPTDLSSQPGGKITRRSMAKPKGRQNADSELASTAGGDPANAGRPDTSQLSSAIEAARQRSGSAGANGD
ncbi:MULTISPECIES: hypothetical protein [unclassified Novosphingobium]|uniref:hypothetical protein n=1 Tax=unclassified Novosphingobium TaxID=2644732 RepID=UPI000EDA7C30|nr:MULTISPECIES: hypothetical protein [unclassified Novosphingobium]HCF25390.1 hypothetical protein [Novosphingobium sp.]HQV04145.1 hypothetical protein [Novosphingobium sp.]